ERVRDTEEIVVKPLRQRLREGGLFAGATVRGDGRVALILDVPSLAARAGLELGSRALGDGGAAPTAGSPGAPSPRRCSSCARAAACRWPCAWPRWTASWSSSPTRSSASAIARPCGS